MTTTGTTITATGVTATQDSLRDEARELMEHCYPFFGLDDWCEDLISACLLEAYNEESLAGPCGICDASAGLACDNSPHGYSHLNRWTTACPDLFAIITYGAMWLSVAEDDDDEDGILPHVYEALMHLIRGLE